MTEKERQDNIKRVMEENFAQYGAVFTSLAKSEKADRIIPIIRDYLITQGFVSEIDVNVWLGSFRTVFVRNEPLFDKQPLRFDINHLALSESIEHFVKCNPTVAVRPFVTATANVKNYSHGVVVQGTVADLANIAKAVENYSTEIKCGGVVCEYMHSVIPAGQKNDTPSSNSLIFVPAPLGVNLKGLLNFGGWIDYCLQYPKWGRQPLGYLRCIFHPDLK